MKSLYPTGIIRNTPDEATVDGALLEAINTRSKDGARRSVGAKVADENSLSNITGDNRLYYHPNSGYYICLVFRSTAYYIEVWEASDSGGSIKYFAVNPSNANIYSQILCGTVNDLVISHVGNFVYCTSSSAQKRWILYWDSANGNFVELEDLSHINFAAGTTNNTKIECVFDTTGLTTEQEIYNSITGVFTKIVAEQRKAGLFNGHISIRYGYKLYDGSLVLHSEQYYVKGGYVYRDVESGDINGICVNYAVGAEASMYNDDTALDRGIVFDQIRLYVDASPVLSILQQWDELKLIRSVCVYVSSIHEGYSLPETISGLIGHPSGFQYLPYSSDLSSVIDPQSMYLLREWKISELTSEVVYDVPDLTNIELNESISPDNFTHHSFLSECTYQYNNRLHIGSINTIPGNPLFNYFRLYFSGTYPNIVPDTDIAALICNEFVTHSSMPSTFKVYMTVWILSDNGMVKKTTEITDNVYEKTEEIGGITITSYTLLMNPVIIYPDIRAKRIVISVENTAGGYIQDLHNIELTPSLWSNFAYHAEDTSSFYNFNDFILLNHELFVRVASVDTGSINHAGIISDKNRVQASKQNNPFVFPAENSYRFGNEKNTVLAIMTAQEPITETVFGQYPLNIFTDNGIYALEQGSGDVLYSNVVELNKEILSNAKGVYGITGGILFVTKEGVKLIEGRQITNISIDVREQPDAGTHSNPVKDDMYLLDCLTNEKTSELYDYLSESFTDYIQAAVIGFSNVFSEIIISNPAYNHSYIYNLETKTWHTITESWSQVLLDRGYKSGLFYDLNAEGSISYHYFQSRPWFLGTAGSKKINQLLVRSTVSIEDNHYNAVVLYGSNDAQTWAAIGKMWITNETTQPVMKNIPGYYKYFMLCYAGKGDIRIISIDVNFTERYTTKIR